jgi:hypothetical protein
MLLVMNSPAFPVISSFIIRFIQDRAEGPSSPHFRGTIRHIQSNQSISFTCWSEAEAFIQNIIPIHYMGEGMDESQKELTPK